MVCCAHCRTALLSTRQLGTLLATQYLASIRKTTNHLRAYIHPAAHYNSSRCSIMLPYIAALTPSICLSRSWMRPSICPSACSWLLSTRTTLPMGVLGSPREADASSLILSTFFVSSPATWLSELATFTCADTKAAVAEQKCSQQPHKHMNEQNTAIMEVAMPEIDLHWVHTAVSKAWSARKDGTSLHVCNEES